MDKNFFSTTRILDGGMGQELLNRGVKPEGTLWGATALLQKKYHKIIVDTHLDFIKAGAEVIVTNSFGSRKRRMIENGVLSKFKSADLNLESTPFSIILLFLLPKLFVTMTSAPALIKSRWVSTIIL